MRKLLCLLFLIIASAEADPTVLRGAEPPVDAKDLPRVPPTEPGDALKTFTVKEGFKIELAAAEPLVVDPVAMAFDEDGRLFVVEMIDYSERRDQKLGRIRMLVDTDGDGKFDKATIYAKDLAWPTAIICWDGGVFVGASPDIFFLNDNNGDGVADEKKVVFSGFGNDVARLNVQQLLNSLNWGLDNRIHGANGGNGGNILLRANAPGDVNIRGKDFCFDPRTMDFRTESGGGQHGLSFDDAGHKFVCSNSHHIQAIMYDLKYSGRNPNYAMPPALIDIAADGPAAEVYRTSPEEPWRVIRTKWRVSGLVPGPIEGGGRSAGYFTGATGVTIFRGDAWGPEFVGDAFIGDAGGNLVHHKKIRWDGVQPIAQRPADEQKREFIASKDNWFRPVQFANGPDGNLYICDMYREVIEHPWSLPESMKKHLDLNSGNDRGRIYRVVKEGVKRRGAIHMGKLSAAELVAMLESPNGWTRDTAARLIYERRDGNAITPLKTLLEKSQSGLARLHALYALDGLRALDAGAILIALQDLDPQVRRHGLKLSEKFATNRQTVSAIMPGLVRLVEDPEAQVRYQLAFTLGEFPHAERAEILANLARKDLRNPPIVAAILSSLVEFSGGALASLLPDKAFRSSAEGRAFLRSLLTLVGSRDRPDEIARVFKVLQGIDDRALAFSLTGGVLEGVQQHRKISAETDQFKKIMDDAVEVAMNDKNGEQLRLEAIRLLGFSNDKENERSLLKLLREGGGALQSAALKALDQRNAEGLALAVLGCWATLTPHIRGDALNVLLKRPDRCHVLLKAIHGGTVRSGELSLTQINFLRTHPDPSVRELAAQLFAAADNRARKEVVDALMPALELKGDVGHGKKIFIERCISCHRLGNDGFALGPDLVTVKNAGKEKLLVNILDPNREVATQYSAYLVETKDGESILGIIAAETAGTITLRQAYGVETVIFRSNIKKLKNQGTSLMPEGLEEGLGAQGVADLLEFISK